MTNTTHGPGTETMLAYARLAGRVGAIVDSQRPDAWKVAEIRGALSRMETELAAARQVRVAEEAEALDRVEQRINADEEPTAELGRLVEPYEQRGVPAGTRTLCGGCGDPIEYLTRSQDRARHGGLAGVGGWRHLNPPAEAHSATPVPAWGETNNSDDSEGDVA